MAITQADIDDFQRFATEWLAHRDAESLSELLHEWEAAREREDTIASVRRGLADIEAGRTRPADEVIQALRRGLETE